MQCRSVHPVLKERVIIWMMPIFEAAKRSSQVRSQVELATQQKATSIKGRACNAAEGYINQKERKHSKSRAL